MTTTPTMPAFPEPAHSFQGEESLLAAAPTDHSARSWMLGNVAEGDLYRPAHRTVYAAIAQLDRDGQPVDPVTVAEALRHQGQLADVGGAPFLHTLAQAPPAASNAGYYGRIVKRDAALRRLHDIGARLAAFAVEPGTDPDRAAGLAQGWLDQLGRDGTEIDLRPADLLQAIRDQEAAKAAGRVAAWPVGSLAKLCGPLLGGSLHLLAALTSTGKSSLAIQTAGANAEARHVLYVTYEMTAADTGRHTLAALAGCTLDDTGHLLDEPDFQTVVELHNNRLDLTTWRHCPDAARLLHEARSLHARSPLGLVVVDYVQKVPAPPDRRYGTREQEGAEISRLLKTMAVRLDVPVLACAQLNRGAVGREPTLADLRDSGALEQDADQVLFLHRDNAFPDLVHALLQKNRMGPKGRLRLLWVPRRAMFEDLVAPSL